jgi:hypothetical protein
MDTSRTPFALRQAEASACAHMVGVSSGDDPLLFQRQYETHQAMYYPGPITNKTLDVMCRFMVRDLLLH